MFPLELPSYNNAVDTLREQQEKLLDGSKDGETTSDTAAPLAAGEDSDSTEGKATEKMVMTFIIEVGFFTIYFITTVWLLNLVHVD